MMGNNMNKKIKCQECNREFTNMTTHLIKAHGLSKKDYLLKYPGAKIVSDTFREWQRNRMKKLYESDNVGYRKIAGSRTFDFVKNNKLRLLLQRDYQSAKKCLQNELWKPAIILYGSLIEAVLREATETEDFKSALDKALKEEIISDTEFHQIHVVKDFRNFVHLHKELSEGGVRVISDYWARTLSEICESLIKRFRKVGKL